MRDPRVDQAADSIERRFPGTIVVISRCPSPDDPDIDWLFDVLNLPQERHRELTRYSIMVGDELFGEEGIPFLVGGVDPAWIAPYWSKYLNGEPARPSSV